MAAKIQVPPIGGQHRDRHVPTLGSRAAYVKQAMRDNRIEHRECIVRHGDDMPEG